jgi:hypothetical protein
VAAKKDLDLKEEEVLPEKIYINFEYNKLEIKKNERRVCGVYMFVNLNNGHKYIGKSQNLAIRMNYY